MSKSLKGIGALEVKDIIRIQTHNLKLKPPNHIQVFISLEGFTKYIHPEIRSALGHLAASRVGGCRLAAS